MYRGGGAHVEAAAGAVHQHQQRVAGELPAITSFCALPPESSAAFCFSERTPCTSKPATASAASRLQLAAQSEEGTVAAAMDLADTEVLGYRKLPASAAP